VLSLRVKKQRSLHQLTTDKIEWWMEAAGCRLSDRMVLIRAVISEPAQAALSECQRNGPADQQSWTFNGAPKREPIRTHLCLNPHRQRERMAVSAVWEKILIETQQVRRMSQQDLLLQRLIGVH
jgi:hypothetical protein